MEAFDYAMGLVSIVVGIAISDLALSFHKLFRHRRTLSWDARTLLAAALTFVVLFSMWFDLWSVHGRPEILNYPFLLSIIVELVLLFLMATAVLPDEPLPNDDLATFYDNNARSIWTFFLLFQISYVGHWLYFKMTSPSYELDHMLERLPEVLMVPVAAGALVLMPRRRMLHLILITSLLIYWLVTYSDNRIGG
jgi:O-antigen/teichoic acid export membrane protein